MSGWDVWRGSLALFLAVVACDDHVISPGVVVTEDGFCGVSQVVEQTCADAGCHDPVSVGGGLDLVTEPYETLTTRASATYGVAYVVPGDPAASFLYQKVAGTQGDQGSRMPIGSFLPDAAIDVVEQWIADGAADCGGDS